MKRRIWIRRRDGIRQRYWVGRKLKNYGSWKRDKDIPTIKRKIKLIDPKDIELVEALQLKPDIEKIKESGDIQKPIFVWGKYWPEQKYQVRDGHHRVLAAQKRGDKLIPAEVVISTKQLKDWRKRKGMKI